MLFVRQFVLFAAQLSFGAGYGHAFAGAHADKVGLELGKGSENVEEYCPWDRLDLRLPLSYVGRWNTGHREAHVDRMKDDPGKRLIFSFLAAPGVSALFVLHEKFGGALAGGVSSLMAGDVQHDAFFSDIFCNIFICACFIGHFKYRQVSWASRREWSRRCFLVACEGQRGLVGA